MKKYSFDKLFRSGMRLFPDLDHKEYYEQEFVEVKELIKELEWCRDWLDVGASNEDQDNQLKVLIQLSSIIDNLDVNCVKPVVEDKDGN